MFWILGDGHLEEGIWFTPSHYFSLSPYLLFVYLILVHVRSIIIFAFIILGNKLNFETRTGPGRPLPVPSHLPTGKNYIINPVQYNFDLMFWLVTSATTNLEHFAHVLRIITPLFLWIIARFGFKDWFILLIWMIRETAAGFQHVISSFRPRKTDLWMVNQSPPKYSNFFFL